MIAGLCFIVTFVITLTTIGICLIRNELLDAIAFFLIGMGLISIIVSIKLYLIKKEKEKQSQINNKPFSLEEDGL